MTIKLFLINLAFRIIIIQIKNQKVKKTNRNRHLMKESYLLIFKLARKDLAQKCFSLLFNLASLLFLLPTSLHSQPQITHGPLVGAVTSASAKILVRVDGQANVRFDLDTDAAFSNPVPTASVVAESDSDFFAIVSVQGLTPDTKYYYRVVLDNVPQASASSFWTFPQEGATTTFTFAFGGCQQEFRDSGSNIGRVWPLVVQDNPRFFIQLGDWTYPDTTDTQENPEDYFSVDYSRVQSNYHSKYAQDYPMSELFKIAPIEYVFDDHDFANNNADWTNPGAKNALRGYKAMFPHYPLANPGNGIWHKFTYGNADFFMLDNRSQRDPNRNGFRDFGGDSLFFKPNETHRLLQGNPNIDGELQMDWLIRELQASTASWKFIGTSVQFNPSYIRSVLEFALLLGRSPNPLPIPTGLIASETSDSWGGFPHSVARLAKAVHDAKIENVIMLSGDSHTAAIDDGANSLFPEVMAGGLDRTNSREIALAEFFGISAWNQGGQTNERDNFNSHYGRITVFGDDSVRMELVDDLGELITSYTQKAGHLVSPVALTVAPLRLNLGEVAVGDSVVQEIIFANTGADEVVVSNIMTSDPQFMPSTSQLILQSPDSAQMVKVIFKPQQVGSFSAELTIESNDPQSPFVVSVSGRGIMSTGVADLTGENPNEYLLSQNYPNPFNAATRISYHLPQISNVSLSIFNISGQQVRQFHFYGQGAGRHSITWDGNDSQNELLASGMYLYRLVVTDLDGNEAFVQSRKLLMMK